jgi:hypothetical protein
VGRVVLSVVVGLFSPFVAIGGGELFQALFRHGTPLERTTPWEVLGGGLLVGLYLAIGQFFVASRERRKLPAKWPTMVAMAAPLVAMCLLSAAVERHSEWAVLAGLTLFGCGGILLGAVAAGRVTLPLASLGSSRRTLLACALALVVVSVLVAVGMIPPTKADTFPLASPRSVVSVFWGIAAFNVLLAVDLLLVGVRAGGGRYPSRGSLAAVGCVAFVLALALAPIVTFWAHGPAMRTTAVLAGFCAAAQFVVVLMIGTVALRLPGERPI